MKYMNKTKFSLADVLSVLAALAFGFVCFMGANFLNIDNDKVWGMPHTTGCIIMALFCSILLFVTAFGAKLLKRTSSNFKTSFIVEIVLLMLFVLFAMFFAMKTSPFTHYFTVSSQKSEIKSKLQKSITQAEEMFSQYESYAYNRENLYKHKLQSIANAKNLNPNEYAEYGFDSTSNISDTLQIANKLFTVHADLFPTNYSDTIAHNGIKEVASNWLQEAKKTTNIWKPIGIVGVVNDIEKNSNEWLNTLVKISKVREKGEQASDFEYTLSFDDVKTHFTKLNRPTNIALVLAVLAYVLMLLSWFVTKRSTRFPGFNFLFGLGKSSENEL